MLHETEGQERRDTNLGQYPTLPRDSAKDSVQLLHAHQVLVEVGVERAYLPGIRVLHHGVKAEWASLMEVQLFVCFKTWPEQKYL